LSLVCHINAASSLRIMIKLVLLLSAFIAFVASKTNPIQEFEHLVTQAAVKSQISACQKDSRQEFNECMKETQPLTGEVTSDFRRITFQVLETAAKNKTFYDLWNNSSIDEKKELARSLNTEIQGKFKQLEEYKFQRSFAGLDKRGFKIPKFNFGKGWGRIFKGKRIVSASSASQRLRFPALKSAFRSIKSFRIREFLDNFIPVAIGITTFGLFMLMLLKGDDYKMHRPKQD